MRLRLLPVVAVLLLASACHIEDHTPSGSRRDESEIRAVLAEYIREFNARDWAACRSYFTTAGGGIQSTAGADVRLIPVDTLFARLAAAPGEPGQYRILRTDLRQVGGYAAAWVNLHRSAAGAAEEQDDVEHFTLVRTSRGWRIQFLAAPWISRLP